jgi:hypothetical protein
MVTTVKASAVTCKNRLKRLGEKVGIVYFD